MSTNNGETGRDGLQEIREDLQALLKLQHEQARELTALRNELVARSGDNKRLFSILRGIYYDEPGNRRRLSELRTSSSYEEPFTTPNPLVSVVIPTYTNVDGLATISVPSVLAQTYENFELIVIGDAAPPETEEALRQVDDPRIVYVNRERRGPYPSNAKAFQRVKGVPPINVGYDLAKGHWIMGFADDDALRPHALELLVGAAQQGRHELCYGCALKIDEDGETRIRGAWPPELEQLMLQAAVYHRGLLFMRPDLTDADFRLACDQSVIRRMLTSGVRFGFVDEIVVDYTAQKSLVRKADKSARSVPEGPGILPENA